MRPHGVCFHQNVAVHDHWVVYVDGDTVTCCCPSLAAIFFADASADRRAILRIPTDGDAWCPLTEFAAWDRQLENAR
jgi:hypothetical protein